MTFVIIAFRSDDPDPVRTTDNAAFFEAVLPHRASPLGSPGGADQTGPIGVDTPLVAGWTSN